MAGAMHTLSRAIYVTRHGDGFRVTAHRGWVTAPAVRDFPTHAAAYAFAAAKLRTKYYSRACVLDETRVKDEGSGE